MTLHLYNNLSENNVLNKNIINKKTLQGTLREQCSIISPIIMIQSDVYPNYNYVYIEDFKRYYFISDITSVRQNLWQISLNVDVLMSFKSKILNLDCIINKQQSTTLSNNYFDDGSYITQSMITNQVINFNNGFNDDADWILVTSGGR